MEALLTAPDVGAKVVTMTIDFSAALSSLSAFVILLDQHLYGGLILKALAKTSRTGHSSLAKPRTVVSSCSSWAMFLPCPFGRLMQAFSQALHQVPD